VYTGSVLCNDMPSIDARAHVILRGVAAWKGANAFAVKWNV